MEAWRRSNAKKAFVSRRRLAESFNQIDINQLNEGFDMNVNEQIVRKTCAAAEGQGLDTEKFVLHVS